MQKVFGIGFSETGTTSLENAIKLLGYNTWRGHWENPNLSYATALYLYKDYDKLFKIISYYDAFSDIPWGGSDLYPALYEHFPNSRFILTIRDAESWYLSFERMITKFDPNLETALDSFYAKGRYGAVHFFKDVFHIETLSGNRQKIIEHYNAHNQAVLDYFKERKAEFMVMDFSRGDGWNNLCNFLNKPIPDQPFPHANKSPIKLDLIPDLSQATSLSSINDTAKIDEYLKEFLTIKKIKKYLKTLRDFFLLRSSSLFDRSWYLSKNPDIVQARVNATFHYLLHGGFEGRDPSPKFSSKWYLETYEDVRKAGINPLVHYLRHGKKEGRALQNKVSLISSKASTHQPKCEIFFIIGTGRSGTTLMAQILNAHSKICVPTELQIAFEYNNNGERLAEIFSSGKNLYFGAEDYIKLVQERCPHNLLEYFDYHTFFRGYHYPVLSLDELLHDFYSSITYSRGKTIFAEQTPWYGQNIKLMNNLFPTARFIHMLRDGRDVAISYARTPWWHKDVNLNLERWARETSKIEEDGLRILKNRLLTIRYEDFILEPERITRTVCNFLNVPFEGNMLNPAFHIDYGQFSRHAVNEISSPAYQKWRKEKKNAFFSDNIYGWKTNKDVEFRNITETTKETLRRFGYEA